MLALYWLLLLAWIYEQTPIPNFIYLVIFRREVAILLYYTREHRKPSDAWRGNMLSNTFIFYGVRLIQENFQPG